LQDKFHPEILTGSTDLERQIMVEWGRRSIF